MMKISKLTLSILAASMLCSAAHAIDSNGKKQRRGEQNQARMDMVAGQVKPLREIEQRVVPRMRGMQYLGPEYDSIAQVYRLKFINKDRVIFVDVDARTGDIIRQQ
jgi:uncharacterized membrane protein YkoI